MTPTSWAVLVLATLGLVLVLCAVTLVPWRVPRPGADDRAAALGEVPSTVVARGRALHAALRPSTYGSLLVGLVAPLLLGLTPAGARIVVAVAQPFGSHWLAQALVGGLFEKQGLARVTVTPELRAQFFAEAKRARDALGAALIAPALLASVERMLDEYHAAHHPQASKR